VAELRAATHLLGLAISYVAIAILNELWKKAILKNLLKAKDLKMSD
jgi:hypothetical protein